MNQIRAGLADASARANEPPRNKLPADAQRMRSWGLGQVGHVLSAVNPFEAEELALLRARSDSNTAPLSDLPLVILTRGVADEPGGGSMAPDSEHRKDHAAQAALSRRGQLIVAARSGHHIQIDEPAVVVQAVRNALMAAAKASP